MELFTHDARFFLTQRQRPSHFLTRVSPAGRDTLELMGAFTQGGKRRGLKVVGPLIGWAATNEEIICVTMATTPRGGGFQSGGTEA